jgi:hypothetical protein
MLAGMGAMRECLYKQFAFLESVANLPFKVGRIRVFHVQSIGIPGPGFLLVGCFCLDRNGARV